MQNQYETSDFQVAVTLYALGFKLTGLDRMNPRRIIFQFEPDGQINRIVEAFFQDQLSINPRLTLLSAKLVKDRLHAAA